MHDDEGMPSSIAYQSHGKNNYVEVSCQGASTEPKRVVHHPCQYSQSANTFSLICCGNVTARLINVLCNHSNCNVSVRHSGMNLNDKNLAAISVKPYSC